MTPHSLLLLVAGGQVQQYSECAFSSFERGRDQDVMSGELHRDGQESE